MRTTLLIILVLAFGFSSTACRWGREQPVAMPVKKTIDDYNRPLAPGESALTDADISTLPDLTLSSDDRAKLIQATNRSLAYLSKSSSDLKYPVSGVSKEQAVRSLRALADLLRTTNDEAAFNAALKSRFRALMSVGCDRRGTVLFTGYYTPIFQASSTPTGAFRYPIYKRPGDLVNGTTPDALAQRRMTDGSTQPYPSRSELESGSTLKGLELVYFRDPYEAYVVEVQGSAKLTMTDGRVLEVGFNGTNGHPYHPIAQDLVNEGKIRKEDLSLATVRAYFQAHPDELPGYKARNPRLIFFTPTTGGPYGSLGQAVTTDVTVATDKTIFPPGAACMAVTDAAGGSGRPGALATLRLDQDTGGAIRAAGRCDLYMGEGDHAERRAGNQFAEGRLYYLLLKE